MRLNDVEWTCIRHFFEDLHARLGDRLREVWLYGSAARGDMWPPSRPMKSDIDVLVITADPLSDDEQNGLIQLTYPLYLECGRQISPQFMTASEWTAPSARRTDFVARVRAEGERLLPS
jgi:predicted nucleotidyltransferase